MYSGTETWSFEVVEEEGLDVMNAVDLIYVFLSSGWGSRRGWVVDLVHGCLMKLQLRAPGRHPLHGLMAPGLHG